MRNRTDRDLIRLYVRHHDHEAFAQLVQRYIAMVRSAAMRMTREPGLADDVTQAAMIVLARRVGEIPPNVVLASWLYTVTHHLAQNALKARARRSARELTAASVRSSAHRTDPELRDVLDRAIARLPDIERGGVVLHFFNDCTHAQIADAMGMSSEAVRKRVSRALVRLRDSLVRHGFDLSTPALSARLRAESQAVSAGSSVATSSIVTVALLAATDAGAISASMSAILANGILGASKSALKWKIAASIALASLGLAGIAVIPMPPPSVQATISTTALPPPATAPTTQSAFIAQVTPEIRLEALGAAPFPADVDQWFALDGTPIDLPHERLADNQVNTENRPDRQLAFLLHAPPSTRFVMEIPGCFTNSVSTNTLDRDEVSILRSRFGVTDPGRETLSVAFNISTSDWRTIATAEGTDPVELEVDGLGAITIQPPVDDPRWGTRVDVRHAPAELIPQMIAIDRNGKEYVHETLNSDGDGVSTQTSSFCFVNLPAKDIKSVKLQVREYDKRVEITNIAMSPGQHTEPKIVVKDLKPKK